jgi:hypothetical protein
MPAVAHDVTALEREEHEDRARTVVYTTLYDLIAAVNEAIESGEEACVVPIVTHLLRAGRVRLFLRDVDGEMRWAEAAPADVPAEALGVPA